MTKQPQKYQKPPLLLIDAVIIALSVWFSFLLRFDGVIPKEKIPLILPSIIIALVVTIPTFLLQRLYRISGSYVSLTDIPKILASSLISTALFAAVILIFRDQPYLIGFPRVALFLYGILLFLFIAVMRFSKRIYWQIIKRGLPSENKWRHLLSKNNFNQPEEIHTVLVTGGAGYVGSVLTRELLNRGYRVKVIDKLLFGDESIKDLSKDPNFIFINGDIQKESDIVRALEDVNAVIHLAAIVGDPACAAQPDLTLKTNYLATLKLAQLCRERAIKRFIFASTCSNYGIGEDEKLTESSVLRPVSVYAESKIYTEKELIKMTEAQFMPIIFRFSTIYGLSPRMRFDLAINTMTMKAYTEQEITIFGGNQWRPFIHVDDVARALIICLETPLGKITGQIFNLGGNQENYLISEVGKIIKTIVPDIKVNEIMTEGDQRNYHVLFNKVQQVFNFCPTKTIKDGVLEIYQALQAGRFANPKDPKYYNYNPK